MCEKLSLMDRVLAIFKGYDCEEYLTLKAKYSGAVKEIEDFKDKIKSLESVIHINNNDIADLKNEISLLDSLISEKDKLIKDHAAACNKYKNEISKAKKEISDLKNKLKDKKIHSPFKLCCKDIKEAKKRHKDGDKLKDIAKELGVSPSMLSKAIRCKSYKHCCKK